MSCVLGFIIFEYVTLDMLLKLALILLISAVTSYLVLRVVLGRFIYRKIKPIYKMIKETKVSKAEKDKVDLGQDVLGEVEKEVTAWVSQQRQEMESMKQMEDYRKQFIGNVSHELKTPLFSIQGFVDTLSETEMDESRRQFYFSRTQKNIERLITIVEDLDVISKIESGMFTLEMSEFNIVDLVQEVLSDLRFQAKERDITMSIKDGYDPAMMVSADQEAVRHVLNNLLVNAIKYGSEGGETKVGFYDLDKDLLIEVSDNGQGIEEKHLKHLFDRFYRVDKSRSRREGGSGLGLSIVKHIIEAHGQSINVRSTVDKGSTFGFTLRKVGA